MKLSRRMQPHPAEASSMIGIIRCTAEGNVGMALDLAGHQGATLAAHHRGAVSGQRVRCQGILALFH